VLYPNALAIPDRAVMDGTDFQVSVPIFIFSIIISITIQSSATLVLLSFSILKCHISLFGSLYIV